MRLSSIAAVMFLAVLGFGSANPAMAKTPAEVLAAQLISANTSDVEGTLAALRAQGPAGLQAFLDNYDAQLQERNVSPAEWQRLRTALDSLCQQRDCYASRLYWYTDLNQAKAAAQASGKPILSLRLLGRLDQELSCANSRFFRIALYPNAEVAQYLREHYILHWQSVRPVPKVTIDFGDGRTMERTLTGNSIHYVLDSQGQPVEALPGLYGPQAFLKSLKQAETVVDELNRVSAAERQAYLQRYHRDRIKAIQALWAGELKQVGQPHLPRLMELPDPTRTPNALQAGQIAYAKAIVERPVLVSLAMAISSNQQNLMQITDEALWTKLAKLHLEESQLDHNSVALMRSKNPAAFDLTKRGILAESAADPLMPIVQKFEAAMALDTVRNEYLLRPQIYQWLLEQPDASVESLNERVYAQLFLTPSSDPWLGLMSAEGYSAIENDGIHQ